MRPEDIQSLLENVASGGTSVSEALARLETLPFEDLGFATVDHHRALRTGYPEVVYGEGKPVEQIAKIVTSIEARGHCALVTRLPAERAEAVVDGLEEDLRGAARILPVPRLLVVGEAMPRSGRGRICVVSAGTSDQPVAEEAACTAEIFGNEVLRVRDVGVSGLHRLLPHRRALEDAEAVVVVAGMDGALPSVVAGLISRPVIAVPTSVGYGACFGGLAPLLTMLNSCGAGVVVVNIDNGFGAGYAANLINQERVRA